MGYWLEDGIATVEIDSISIFIPETLDEDSIDDQVLTEVYLPEREGIPSEAFEACTKLAYVIRSFQRMKRLEEAEAMEPRLFFGGLDRAGRCRHTPLLSTRGLTSSYILC